MLFSRGNYEMLTTNSEYELLKESLKKESFHTLKRRILNGDFLDPLEYKAVLDNTKDARMAWWREARFGFFIHFSFPLRYIVYLLYI